MLLTLSGEMESFLQFCTVLIIFIFVLLITWASTKWIANAQKGLKNGSNIEIIETQSLAANKYLQIIKVGDQYLLIAVCKDTVTMLAEIPAEQIQISEESKTGTADFKKILDVAKRSIPNRKNKE